MSYLLTADLGGGGAIKNCLIAFIFTLLIGLTASPSNLPAELKDFSWQTGDVIAVSELFYDWSTFFFEAATGSRFGHVGIVSVENNRVYVFEENDPQAQKTDIGVFLGRAGKDPVSNKALVAILRPKQSLSEEESKRLTTAGEQLVLRQIPYNQTQMMNSESLNCSEFVRVVYAYAGREVGKIEEIGTLNLKAFNGWLLSAWQWGAGKVNPKSLVVSPMSVVLSPSLYVVYSTVPTRTYLSDREIYNQWKAEGFIKELSRQTYVPEFILNTLGSRSLTEPWRPNPARDDF